jgi:hypothetical protein
MGGQLRRALALPQLSAGGSGDDFRAGIERAISLGWLWRHDGTYVKFTDAGAALFARTVPATGPVHAIRRV